MTNEEYKDIMCEHCKYNCDKCSKELIECVTTEDGVKRYKCLNYERIGKENE